MRRQNAKIAITVLGLAVGLVGCTQTYNVSGLFETGGQAFYGTVTVGVSQVGTIEVSSADGRMSCSGQSKVTQMPSGYSLIGAQGAAQATCNDGRTFKIDFIQTTQTGGRGQGIDSLGNVVQLYFDTSEGLSRSMLDQHRLNTLVQ